MNRRLCYLPLVLLALCACTAAPQRPEQAGALASCGKFPNCVNSQSGEGVHAIEALSATPAQWDSLKLWLRQQESWRITLDEGLFLQAVVVTPIMRYRDDVQLLYQPDQMLVQIRSSSRLGIGDMSANRNRVESLRREMQAL
jgi:uncharacterized protein (DUF1499 family)